MSDAVGKYVLYHVALIASKIEFPLYLAVPRTAYSGILREPIGKRVINHIGMKVMVFDSEREEIVRWIS